MIRSCVTRSDCVDSFIVTALFRVTRRPCAPIRALVMQAAPFQPITNKRVRLIFSVQVLQRFCMFWGRPSKTTLLLCTCFETLAVIAGNLLRLQAHETKNIFDDQRPIRLPEEDVALTGLCRPFHFCSHQPVDFLKRQNAGAGPAEATVNAVQAGDQLSRLPAGGFCLHDVHTTRAHKRSTHRPTAPQLRPS
jgi:hypothetical protein